MEHDVSPRPFRLGARAHNPKGERAPVALCREPTEAAAETVGSNPAPATKDPRFYYLGFSLAFLWDTAITLP